MLGPVAKFLLACTSLVPMLVTWAYADSRARGLRSEQLQVLVVAALLVAICYLVIRGAQSRLPIMRFEAAEVRPADTEVVGFIVAYLLPLVSTSTTGLDYSVLLFIGCLLGLVIWASNAYSFNPLLTILGYHFYEVRSRTGVTYLVLSAADIRRPANIGSVVQLTKYLIMTRDG